MTQALIALASSGICLILGLFVYIYNRKNLVNLLFFIINILIFIWISGDFVIPFVNDLEFGIHYNRVAQIGGILLSPVYALFSLMLVGNSPKRAVKNPVMLLFSLYAIIFLFFIPTPLLIERVDLHPFREKAGILLVAEIGMLFFSILFNFYQIMRAMKKSDHNVRKKLIYFNLAILIALVAPIIWLILISGSKHFGNYPVYLFVVLYAILTAYAIFRYQFMDIHIVLKRSTVSIAIISTVSLLYYLISMLFRKLLVLSDDSAGILPGVLAVACLAILYIPFRHRLDDYINRLLFRKNYLYAEALGKMADETALLMEIEDLSGKIVGIIRKVVSVQDVQFLLFGNKTNNDIISLVKKHVDEMGIKSAGCMNYQDKLLFPILFNNELLGAVIIGNPPDNKPYDGDDIRFLKTLTKQSAIALSNARAYRKMVEQERTDRDLEIAAQIQKLFMPAVIEQPKGLEITAHYAPAMAIGGDYYDVIRIDDNRALIVLMDISGHGSSAAIVLSMISSYFHSNACRFENPGNLLTDLNREMIRRLKGQKYATGIVLDWDSVSRTVSWANAGHPDFLRLDEEGRLLPVEKGADPPVGVLEDLVFQTRRLKLGAGEKMVLMTDGVYEAMNPREEMLGMEAVSARITELGRGQAGEIVHGLLETVRVFRGHEKQSDDIAIMVVRAAG